jgi:hypothetical protein
MHHGSISRARSYAFYLLPSAEELETQHATEVLALWILTGMRMSRNPRSTR